ncbi:unnamed protein product [Rotaria sordida]|uniref:Uncharacterized protein n=1 Tax=Rotaria sordida TaxID=392033 RepID=A0A819GP25_9BILA|nr:unnamed protein product [Rotaria sordida]CAF3886619.1 unnamed protein product [Rotaria sordida]
MQQRGWTQDGLIISVIPDPHYKYYAILVPLPSSATLYTDVSTKMKSIPSVQIVSIEEIQNPYLEETYEGMKKLITKQCPNQNPNERELFYGTKNVESQGITEDGYDDRYFNKDGHSAYFADDPKTLNDYTELSNMTGYTVVHLPSESFPKVSEKQIEKNETDQHEVQSSNDLQQSKSEEEKCSMIVPVKDCETAPSRTN